ncbi:MAG TPA: tRNA uridine-5-carboxymethylaminomethyl(34) synthesis GTPase MnmE [Candidatus Binatia bacterium]|nr:tRNA uridine-5-carboxymethylaminomethyl(34) synthesis GTPase MnmE [Candidatus Binatia bacterium]
MYAADTIAAIATPPGAGGIGIVRVSGPLAGDIAQRLFAPARPSDWKPFHLAHGTVRSAAGEALDDGLAVRMRAPHSYTGEDVLELHCHGSPIGLRRVLAAVLACGARIAEPGEFTRRAFLNGRIDLTQAEAVAELIRARTDAGAAIAAEQIFGRVSSELDQIRSELISIRVQLEVQIDFSDEDVAIAPQALSDSIARALGDVQHLVDSYGHGRLVREGLRVVIAGKPNVGKSSLLNALLRADRAIVTAIPGTTRDIVEESADFDGVPVVLSDTAGLRPSADPVEAIGVERARAKVADADVVVAVFDGSRALDEQDTDVLALVADQRSVVAVNKADLPPVYDESTLAVADTPVVRISALTGVGLDELRKAVVRRVGEHGESRSEAPTISVARHRDALLKTGDSLRLALDGLRRGMPPDLIAVDIQNAADHLAEITGVITSEDVLDRIFSEFCIGK